MTLNQKMFLTENATYLYELPHVNLKCVNVDAAIQEWQDCLDCDNLGYFEKRLNMQGVSHKEAAEILENTKTDKPAEWTNSAESILDLTHLGLEEIISRLKYRTLNGHSEFYSYLAPILLYAQQELSDIFQTEMLDETACADIMDNIFEHIKFIFKHFGKYQLNKFAGTLLPQPVENLSEYYGKFCDEMLNGGYERSFLKYPCLARSLIEQLNLRISFVREVVLNFYRDRPFEGQITAFNFSAGDIHNYGRSVIIAVYNHKTKVVYKPQSGQTYVVYGKLLSFLNEKGILTEMKYAKVFSSYPDHCYIEFIENDPITESDGINRYYYRIGQLICLFYVLGSGDMHFENIVACGEYPVAIDLETLLTAKVNKLEAVNNKFSIKHKSSEINADEISIVTRSLMLDFGGKRSGTAFWDGEKANVPYLANGNKIDFNMSVKNILNGFNDAYSQIWVNKDIITDKLSLFNTCSFRSILRSTQIYCEMLDHLQCVKYLENGLTRSFEAERLFAAYRNICNLKKLKSIYPIFNEECVSVLRGDVPIFFANANECKIFSAAGVLCDSFFELSPIDNAKKMLEGMNEDDRITQNKIINISICSAMHTNFPNNFLPVNKTNILSKKELVNEAEKIFDQLIERQIFHSHGIFFLTVYTEENSVRNQTTDICVANNGLYSGLMGVALFCGALFRVTNKEKYKKLAVKIVDKACEDFTYINQKTEVGISNGIGGYALALKLISNYLDEQKYMDMAASLISLPYDISEINKIDCFGGLSGYIIAACAVGADARYIEQAADKLMTFRVPFKEFKVWKNSRDQKPLIGLGHGMSGIALALAETYRILPKKEYLQGIHDALKYESDYYNNDKGWPDLRGNHSGYMSGICSGAPGVGITRLAMKGISSELDNYLDKDISNAVRHSTDSFPLNKDDLCCGNCSGIDFLITAGRQCSNNNFLINAGKELSWIVERKKRLGVYGNNAGAVFEPIGFFDGICGIGYELLRWCDSGIKCIFEFDR